MTHTVLDATREFSVTTERCDDRRVRLRIIGHLGADAAALLYAVADSHLQADRSYQRVDLLGVTSFDQAALAVLSHLHHRVLERHGTLIFTGVTGWLGPMLQHAEGGLFLLPATVADAMA